jgi:hypothetical protein
MNVCLTLHHIGTLKVTYRMHDENSKKFNPLYARPCLQVFYIEEADIVIIYRGIESRRRQKTLKGKGAEASRGEEGVLVPLDLDVSLTLKLAVTLISLSHLSWGRTVSWTSAQVSIHAEPFKLLH